MNRNYCNHSCCNQQRHVHEIQASVKIAESCRNPHNHRLATVSDEALYMGNDHCHDVKFRTDYYDGHFHTFSGRTTGAIEVCDGRHVHYLQSVTSENDEHCHEFRLATLIEDPIGE